MLDPLAEQVGIGGAVAVILVATVMKFLPAFMAALKTTRNGNGNKSAGLTAAEWKNEIRTAVKEMLFETAPRRHEELERLMEKVIGRELAKRDKVVRDIFREELRRR